MVCTYTIHFFKNPIMKQILLFNFLLIFSANLYAQVGIGTITPDPSAQLEIQSDTKGVLIPRLTTDQIKNIPSLKEGLMIYNLTTHKPCYYDGTRWLYSDNTLVLPVKIGDSFGGGIVVYVDQTGLHGIVAASIDQSAVNSTAWGCNGTSIIGATGTTIGTGQSNTTAIVNGCSTAGIAARLCDDLVLNSYSDWYLPSRDELALLCAARQYLNLANGLYYSSSQYNSTGAYYTSGTSCGSFGGDRDKNFTMTVRAVRTF